MRLAEAEAQLREGEAQLQSAQEPRVKAEVEALGIVEESERFEIEARLRAKAEASCQSKKNTIEENDSTTIKNQPKRSRRFSDSGKFARRLWQRFTRLVARLVRAHRPQPERNQKSGST